MTTPKNEYDVIRLSKDGQDRIIPKNFFDVLVLRFFPSLAMIFIFSVSGIAALQGDDGLKALSTDRGIYEQSLILAVFVSIPSMVWIFLNGNALLKHVADFWYLIIAVLITMTILFGFVMFPEAKAYGLRTYAMLSVPVFVMNYFLFVRGYLPITLCYPANAFGICVLIYGLLIGIVF